MKKKCGYLDKKGSFHRSLFACNNANLDYEMREVRDTIEATIRSYAIHNSRKFEGDLKTERDRGTFLITQVLEEFFYRVLVQEKEDLLIYSKKIEVLVKRYEKMNSRKALPKPLRKDWWLRREI